MTQLAFKIDLTKCVGCRACEMGCKSELNTPSGVRYRKVLDLLTGTYPNIKKTFVSMSCFHCETPACTAACPTGAVFKEEKFGIVLIDQKVCIGCRRCEAACPYGAPQFNYTTGKMEKCTFCYHRILEDDGETLTGLKPACVTTCIGRALEFGEYTGEVGSKPDKFANPDLTKPSVTFAV